METDSIAFSLDALTKEIQSPDALSERVLEFSNDVVHFSMFAVDFPSFKHDLNKQIMSLRYRLVESVVLANRGAMKSTCLAMPTTSWAMNSPRVALIPKTDTPWNTS